MKLCGWDVRIPKECPVEYSDALWSWHRWEQRERGKNRETGEAVTSMEFVPHIGTRAEFMREYRREFERWMPHVHDDNELKFMLKLQEEEMTSPEQRASPTMSNTRADFGAAIEIQRLFSATCAFPERINLACLVMSYLPEEVLDFKSNRRKGKCAHPEEASSNAIIEPVASACTPQSAPSIVASASTPAVVAPVVSPAATVGLNRFAPDDRHFTSLRPARAGVRRFKFKTDSFTGIFSTSLKPSALIYNKMREDLEHIVKYGTSLHGEVFIGGLRVRRADGKPHSEPLPEGFISQKVEGSPQVSWTLRDAREGEIEATFPELEVNFVVSDGSLSQVKISKLHTFA